MKIDTGRLQRAIRLEAKPTGTDTYRVRGGAATHVVEIDDGGYVRCDCIDAQVRGDTCKHSLLVRLLSGDKEVVEALREPVPAPDNRSARRRTRPIRSEGRDSGRETAGRTISARAVAPHGTISDGPRGQSRG